MKRKITLYIDGKAADLADQNLILYNWAFTDIETPTAVRNSFSKQITLPATPTNDAIFGHYYRLDHATGSGFTALRKTPFVIYDDTGDILERGYLRLDGIARKGRSVEGYSVTLFGGLGAFFYALSYNDDGSKMTLADIDYLGDGDEDELDFVINAASVQAAWNRLGDHTGMAESKWDVISFAPCYEGIPDANFNADKGLITAASCGQPDHVDDAEGNTYGTRFDKLLVKLPKAVDEWAAKDLRSYLQRPVFSMEAFLYALTDYVFGNAQLDISAVPTKCYRNLWKTLPLIPSLTTEHEETGTAAITRSSTSTAGPDIGTETLASALATAYKVTASFRTQPLFSINANYSTLKGHATNSAIPTHSFVTILFFQWVAEDENGNAIGGSKVKCVCDLLGGRSVEDVATAMSFTPVWSAAEYDPAVLSTGGLDLFYRVSTGVFRLNSGLQFLTFNSIVTQGAYRWRLYCHYYLGYLDRSTMDLTKLSGGTSAQAGAWHSSTALSGPEYTASGAYFTEIATTVKYSITTEGRSGATITKQRLLASKYTPAEYLIGWAKTFGLVFRYDSRERKVHVLPRNSYFQNEVTDLTDRVDRGQEFKLQPLNCGSRWYDFRPNMAEGAWAKEYAALYGIPYGLQRVDTGYQFNDEAKNIIEGLPFRAAADKLDHGRYWFNITQGGTFRPSVFLDNGVTCIYWGTGDKQYENPVSILTSATIASMNSLHAGYDLEGVNKVEFRDDAGKGIDGEDVLLWWRQGYPVGYNNYKLSDDTALMLALNNGVPCWNLDPSGEDALIPTFQRNDIETIAQTYTIHNALDFGVPKELDMPFVIYNDNATLYAKYWAAFLRDRLDEDTKVLRCRVNLQGLQAGPDLLRRFWWYGGSLWVLNKITNYSLTTWDLAECEFIQVQDMANYINGQDY